MHSLSIINIDKESIRNNTEYSYRELHTSSPWRGNCHCRWPNRKQHFLKQTGWNMPRIQSIMVIWGVTCWIRISYWNYTCSHKNN